MNDEKFQQLAETFFQEGLKDDSHFWSHTIRETLPNLLKAVWEEASTAHVPSGILLTPEQIQAAQETIQTLKKSGAKLELLPVLTDLLAERERLINLLHDSEGLDAYVKGWNARISVGEWTTLRTLGAGNLFEVQGGARYINLKSFHGIQQKYLCCQLFPPAPSVYLPGNLQVRKIDFHW